MKEQQAIQQLLLLKFEEARTRNPQLSRRAFSKRLGLSAGAASELLNGRRHVSIKIAERIAARLGLDPQERAELFGLFPVRKRPTEPHPVNAAPIDSQYLQLSADQFRVIGDWYHFGILSLMRTKTFKSRPEWIARRLGISLATATAALERLQRIGLIEQDADGKLKRSGMRFRTTDDIHNASVQRAHLQYLEKASNAIHQFDVNERDFTSLMMSIDPDKLPRVKQKIRQFQDDLSSEFETEPGEEVYQLCMQFFPLTRKEGDPT